MSYLILLILLAIFATVAYAGRSFAPWVPAWTKDLPRIFKLANLQPGEIFYDLGCGNGRTVVYAAKNYSVKAIGLEIAMPLYFICKIRQLFSKNKNLIFKYRNLFKEDLSSADVIYFFGMPNHLAKLGEKLKKELKPGARVISYVFPIPDWQPLEVSKPDKKDIQIFLYKINN